MEGNEGECDQWESTTFQGVLPGCLQEEFLNLDAEALLMTGCSGAMGRGSKPAILCEQTPFAFENGHSTNGNWEQKPLCCTANRPVAY